MKTISLVNTDQVTLIDDEDFERVSKHRWWLMPQGRVKSSSVINGKQPYLARFVLRTPQVLDTDHINLDPLDNRKENLRIATRSQNIANSRKHRDGTSQYKGVSWHKKDRKWQARIMHEGVNINLGQFESEEEAARTYDIAALKYFRKFSKLNFLERITIE